MTKNTITSIEDLKPGDIFKLTTSEELFVKTTLQPVRKFRKLVFEVKPLAALIPKDILNKTSVIFISKSKSIVI